MWTAFIVILSLVAAQAAGCSFTPTAPRERIVADKDFLVKQKNIIQLLIRPHQENLFKKQFDIGNSYDLEANLNNYNDVEKVKGFLSLYKHGNLLPRGMVFSMLHTKHSREVERVFYLFYLAKDYDIFYKTACWARDRINEGIFVYAFSVAVLHRQDTQNITLPPPYELQPDLFVDTSVIQKASEARETNKQGQYIIQYNYTSHIHNYNDCINYFTEDVGLSTYLTYLNYEYPAWLSARKLGSEFRRGELFYYTRQQLLARYQLERLSRGLPPVELYGNDIYNPVKIGYNPELRYPNGKLVPARPAGLLHSVDQLKNIERRILDFIDNHTVDVNDTDGFRTEYFGEYSTGEVLGNIIQGNADSVNKQYFESYYDGLLGLYGHIVDPDDQYGLAPSALVHCGGAARDPIFYSILKKIVDLFDEYKNQLRNYERDALAVDAVKIESVDVDELVTYYDDFSFSLNNAVEDSDNLDIQVRQLRLNHKPFSVRINVNSSKAGFVTVKIFLGPKYDYLGRELPLDEKRKYLVELDRFPYQLVPGKNVIERNSSESSAIVDDQLTTSALLKKVNDALEDKDQLYIGSAFRQCGFPKRLLIPHGRKDGFPMNLFVFISRPLTDNLNYYPSVVSCGPGFHNPESEFYPFGFPFDCNTSDSHSFEIPNIYQKDVYVFHKTEEEINKPK